MARREKAHWGPTQTEGMFLGANKAQTFVIEEATCQNHVLPPLCHVQVTDSSCSVRRPKSPLNASMMQDPTKTPKPRVNTKVD